MFLYGCVLFLCNVCVLNRVVYGAVLNNVYKLDIVHYNDFHDRFEETSVPYPICQTNDSQCLGGFPRLYYEINAMLREKPDALLLNAGDTFQGTYWYTLLKWNVTQTFINMLPNDAHAIGNHEFDDGVAGLAPYLEALKAPVLAANMDARKEPSLKGLFLPHIILERKGRKIGIIGLVTPDTAATSNSQGVVFLDPIETVKKEAQLLTEQGINIIIVLSHCGLNVDQKMAREVGENIDIIVGGHSHSLLWNGTAPSNETVSGPYPVMMKTDGKPDHNVLVVQASALTKYLGNLTAYFDSKGELQNFEGYPIFLNRSIPEDLDIKALLEPYKEKLHELVHEVIGYSSDDLLGDPCGAGECALGDLVANSFLNATQEKYQSKLPNVAFLVRNMIRGSLSKGDITRGDVINALPYTNRVVTFVLKGRHLLDAFEFCLKTYWTLEPFNSGMMPHIAGMKLTLNVTTGKVVSASVKEGEEYQTLDQEREYQVTTVAFLVKGGNGFTMLKDHAENIQAVAVDEDALEDYIEKVSPVRNVLDNRLTIVT